MLCPLSFLAVNIVLIDLHLVIPLTAVYLVHLGRDFPHQRSGLGLARCGKVVNNIGTEFDVLENYKKDDTVLIVLSMYGMFLKEGKRNGEITKIKKLIKEHCHSSWLFTLKKDVDSITDEMILMNPEEAEYDLSLNGTIVFFELIAESYQQIYTN